jgi:hypothetical protein
VHLLVIYKERTKCTVWKLKKVVDVFILCKHIKLGNLLYPQSKQQSVIKNKACNALLQMLLACISIYLKSGTRYKFLILTPTIRAIYTCIDVSKDEGIRGYLSKPKGICEQQSLRHADLHKYTMDNSDS